MASQGPLSPGTVVDDSAVGSVAWTSPSSAATQNDLYAAASSFSGQSTHYLKATNFGFSIPSTAVILGVTVEIEKISSASVQDAAVKLVKGGVVVGNDHSDAALWLTSDTNTYDVYGGVSDMWGIALSPADVNASNFGVVLEALINLGTAQVDHIRITVTYQLVSDFQVVFKHE